MFDPKKFLDVAQGLVALERADEEHFRTAVGRAYYAAFLTGQMKLLARFSGVLTIHQPEKSEHVKVQLAFSTLGKPQISAKLADLFSRRVSADYHPWDQISYKMAEESIQLGENLLNLIEGDP